MHRKISSYRRGSKDPAGIISAGTAVYIRYCVLTEKIHGNRKEPVSMDFLCDTPGERHPVISFFGDSPAYLPEEVHRNASVCL